MWGLVEATDALESQWSGEGESSSLARSVRQAGALLLSEGRSPVKVVFLKLYGRVRVCE